jgi:hypothetical protein
MASPKQKTTHAERQAALIAALQAQPDTRLSPSELKDLTGVPKGEARKLLTAVAGVHIKEGRPIQIWYSRPGGAA